MTSQSRSYDDAAYSIPVQFSASTTAGANGVTTKFCAFEAMRIKQVVSSPNLTLVTTAAGSQPLIYCQSGTTTATTTLTVLTSAAYDTVVDDIEEVALARGDVFWYTHGTDAQTSRSVAFECALVPGTDLAA